MASPDLLFQNRGVFSDASINDFLTEAEEQLSGVEEQLLLLEEDRTSKNAILEVFRHLHGLKGNSGLILSEAQTPLPPNHPLYFLQKGSHAVESLVEQFRREDEFRISDDEMAFLFEALDFLQKQSIAFRSNRIEPVSNPVLLAQLGLSGADFDGPPAPQAPAEADVFRNAAGQNIRAARLFLQSLAGGEPESSIGLQRCADTLVRAARYASEHAIESLAKQQLDVLQGISPSQPVGTDFLAKLENLQRQIEASFDASASNSETNPSPIEDTDGPALPEAVLRSSIRVDQQKIDDLMRMAGHLSVLRHGFADVVEKLQRSGIDETLSQQLRLAAESFFRASENIRDTVVTLRLFPIRNLFKRFQRLARDLSVGLGKEISLVCQGEEIELDKALLDQIGEPLGHLLRNAADHGIELPEHRVAAGKPPHGTILMSASREGSLVVIQISDDGKGLDETAIVARAKATGLLPPEHDGALDAAQMRELIFQPGFSTARNVSEISGRGVGMDVVRQAISNLNGTITVSSAVQAGTSFEIRLPATLLVTKGVLLESGGEEYILPVESIRDLLRLDSGELREYQRHQIAPLGLTTLPVIPLRELLGRPVASTTLNDARVIPVAVLSQVHYPFGLAVDRFKGEVQVLVKPLDPTVDGSRLCIGAAILGDGRVVLVLNPIELSNRASQGTKAFADLHLFP